MELSRGIIRRVISFTLCFVLLSMCTGCVGVTDRVRPDLNLNGGLRIFAVYGGGNSSGGGVGDDESDGTGPDVTPGQKANVVQSTWSGGSPNNNSFEYKNPNKDQDISKFVATTTDMLNATDYGTYLQQQVYDKLVEATKDLDKSVLDNLYIRVFHTGYDYQNEIMRKVAGYSATQAGRSITTAQVVGGTSLITLASDWLGDLDVNRSHRDTQVSYAQSSISSYMDASDFGKNWYELSGSNLPAIYYKLMGRDSANFSTLQDYYDAIASDPYRNIPNYNLYYYTGVNSTNKMVFNKTSGSVTEKYVEGVPISTVDKLFGTYNQYIDRNRARIDNVVQDSDSLLRYSIDGYTKTIIFVGTKAGGNLKSTVGDAVYSEIFSIINGAYKNTDISSIKAIKETTTDATTGETSTVVDYSNFGVVPAGSKGVD